MTLPNKSLTERARDIEARTAAKLKSPSAMLLPPDVKDMLGDFASIISELACAVEHQKPYVDEG